jgi:hypothetical protein
MGKIIRKYGSILFAAAVIMLIGVNCAVSEKRVSMKTESLESLKGGFHSSCKGIYVLIPFEKRKDNMDAVLNNPAVSGICIAAEWRELEPEEGKYDFSLIDAVLKKTRLRNKTVSLRVLPGISTPEWVYRKGAKQFEFTDINPNHDNYSSGRRDSTYQKKLSIPVPWDTVFLSCWEKFVAAYGSHCRKAENIAMIHITGPTRHSAEMHLPKEPEDKKNWIDMGYSAQKLSGAWKRALDAFASAFPQTPVVLNLSPVIFDDEVMETVVRYGYGKYGQRFFMQNNILLADNKGMKRRDWAILRQYSAKTTIGFQRQILRLKQRGVLSENERVRIRKENFEGMFSQGMALGAKYFEIGLAEALDFPEIVRKAAEQL